MILIKILVYFLMKKLKMNKIKNDINNKMPKCIFPECTVKNAIFNLPDKKKGIYCKRHSTKDMTDVVSKM